METENIKAAEPAQEETNVSTVGIATILPPTARELLVSAAQRARDFPEDNLYRKRLLANAIRNVKLLFPEYFVERG